MRPKAATAASKPSVSSFGDLAGCLLSLSVADKTNTSNRKLANAIGSKAGPRFLSVPSRNCSAFSRAKANCSAPVGSFFSRETNSVSWLFSFTSKALVLAGGRAISSANRPTRKASSWCSLNSAKTVQRKAHLASVADAKHDRRWLAAHRRGLGVWRRRGFFGSSDGIRLAPPSAGGRASSSRARRAPRAQASRACPCACRPSARAKDPSHPHAQPMPHELLALIETTVPELVPSSATALLAAAVS